METVDSIVTKLSTDKDVGRNSFTVSEVRQLIKLARMEGHGQSKTLSREIDKFTSSYSCFDEK